MMRLATDMLFIDVEASGLGSQSFPIELGWAWLDGPSGGALIRPASHWDLASWREEAQAIHGITLDDLNRSGRDPRDVADDLVRRVAERREPPIVVSDAPDYDQIWLDVLFAETPMMQPFRLSDDERLRIATFGFEAATRAAAESPTPLHRAEADAVRLRDRWVRLTTGQVG